MIPSPPPTRPPAALPHRPRPRALHALAAATSLLAISAFADVAPAQLDAARALFNTRGQSAAAEAAFNAIAAEDPQNHAAQLHLGILALRRDDTDAAIAHLEKAVALAPADGASHKALGDAYGRSAQKASVFKKLGFAKKCLAAYERAVVLDPSRVEFHQCLFEYYRQAPGFAGGGRDKALAEAATIKRLDPHAGRQAFAILLVSEKKYAEAFAEFEQALADSPDDPVALYQLGRLAALTGHNLDRAIAALRRCLELAPPPGPQIPAPAELHWRLGTLLEKKSDLPAARDAYKTAVRIDPAFAPATEALARLRP